MSEEKPRRSWRIVTKEEDLSGVLSQYPEGGNIFDPIDPNHPQNRVQAAIAEAFKRRGGVIVTNQPNSEGTITTWKFEEEETGNKG
jgi:hypothetical protein